MANDILVNPQGELEGGTPLGVGEIDPKSGLDFEPRTINVEALKASKALSKGDLTGTVYTEDIVVPKSVYRILGDNYNPEFDPEYNARLLSREQSNAGKFVAFLNQAVIGEIGGGTIEGLGYMLDLPMMFDLAEGTEQEFGNAFTRIGTSMRTWAEETTPVYTDPTAPKFNPVSFEWWMKNLPSVASTASLVIPSMGGMAALKGIGNLLKLTDMMGDMGKYSKLFSTALGQAIMSRHMESMMEAKGVYDQGLTDAKGALYNKYSDQIQKEIKALPLFTPYNPELGPTPGQYTKEQYDADINKIKNKWEDKISQEAIKVASMGAANTYQKNWVLLLQDLPEYMLLNRFLNKGVKSIAANATEKSAEVAKFLGMNMPKFYASQTAKQIANAIGEGFEEGYQFLTNEQSSETIRHLADPDKKTTLVDQLYKNYDNGDFWTNVTMGIAGAGFIQATMAGINSKALSDSGKARVKQLTELSPLINKLHQDYIAAEESGDPIAMKAAMQGFITAVGIKSEQFGNREHLLNMVDALASDDQSVLSSYEIDKGAREFFKGKNDIAKELKDNINSIAKRYSDGFTEAKKKGLTDKQAVWIASALAHDNHMLEYLNKELTSSRERVASFDIEGYNKPNPSGEQLSDKGKQAFEIAYKKRDLERRLANVEKLLTKEDLTKEDKNKYEKRKASLESKIELANNIITELSQDKTLSKKQRAIDAKLHGDLTKAEYTGIMPSEEVMSLLDAMRENNSYEQEVEFFREAVNKDRDIMNAMEASNKKTGTVTPKPNEPPVEEKTDLDVGDVAKYTSTDGEEKRGVIQNIDYAQKDTEGNEAKPSAENVDNIITIQPINDKNEPVGKLEHVSGATVIKESTTVQSEVVHGTAEEDIEFEEEDLPPEGPAEGDNIKDQNRRRTNSVNKGLMEFISYTQYEERTPENKNKLKKLEVRNKELDKFVSDPNNQDAISKAIAIYSLDLENKSFREFLDKTRREKRMSVTLLDAVDTFLKTGKLSKEDAEEQEYIIKLMKLEDFVGNLPISVELKMGGKSFKGGMFVHTTSKTRSKIKNLADMRIYEKMRESLVQHLLDGDKVYSGGGDLNHRVSTNRGNPINIDKTNNRNARKRDVKVTFGFKSYKDIELFILKSSTMSAKLQTRDYENPQLHKDNSSVETISFDFSSTGSVFVKTDKTINGQPFAVKLNKSFISADHAYLIFNAFRTLAKTELVDDRKDNNGYYSGKLKNPNKKGYIGAYNVDLNPHEKNPKENGAAWNITAGELLDLLVVHGENLTDPNHPRYRFVNQLKQMSEEHKKTLEAKRLFLQRGYDSEGNADGIYLCYGTAIPIVINTSVKGVKKSINYNRINLTRKRNKSEAKDFYDDIDNFVKWIQNNKTYAVHLENNRLGLKLNGGFLWGKNFRLGKKGLVVNPTDLPNTRYTYKLDTEISRAPNETYVEFLLKNGFVTTDMEAVDGKLFTTPYIHLGVNQNPEDDFGFNVGEPKETNGPVSPNLDDIEKVREEDIKEDLKTEADKNITKRGRKRVSKEEKESKKEDESVRNIMEDDEPVLFRRRPKNIRVYEVQDLENELKWIRETLNLGEDELHVEKDLAKMILKGKTAWGIFSDNAITIYEAAEKGTIYHEAFHKVSLAYLTQEERDAIYRNARLVYKMPKEKYSDKQVEEKLAEEFRTFVLTKQKASQPSVIRTFFTKLYNTIKALFFRVGVRMVQTDIDRLFNQIYSGKYKFAKTLNKNIGPRLRTIMGEEFSGITTYKDITTYTKYLAKKLIKENGITNLKDASRIEYEPLINYLNKKITRLEDFLKKVDISERERNDAIKMLDMIKGSLGEKDEFGMYPKFGVWVSHINRFLSDIGITYRGSSEEEDSIADYEKRYEDLSEEEQGDKIDNSWNDADYYKPLKDSALANVKFVISTLHETEDVDNVSSMIPFADGNKVWYKLLNDIIEYDNVEEMIDKIRQEGETQDYYPYTELADILEKSTEMFRTQFQTTFEMYKHQHLTVSFVEDRDGEVNMWFDKSGHNELSRTTALRWNELLQYDRNIVQITEEERKSGIIRKKSVNGKFFSDLVVEYKDKVLDYYNDKTNVATVNLTEAQLETLFRRVSKLLSKIHIDVDTTVLRHLAYTMDTSRSLQNNLYKFLGNIQELFGPELVMTNEGKLRNIITKGTIRALADAYSTVNTFEESDMIFGPEGNTIWRYGRLNLATDNVRRIKRSQKWAAEKASRIGNKNSRILNSFIARDDSVEAIAEAKLNRDNFGLVTMSNFKKRGNRDKDKTSRDYLHLNVTEDYLFKSYAILIGNLLPLPTLADRRTYYMMEGVKLFGMEEGGRSTNVIVSSTPEGEVVFSDEVLNTFYNYYLDEKERVDEAIKVRDNYLEQKKIYAGNPKKIRELQNSLIKNYHYAGNDYNVKKGNAYNFIHFKGYGKLKTPEEIKARISEDLNNRLKDEIKFASNQEIIDVTKNKTTKELVLFSKKFRKGLAQLYANENQPDNFGVLSLMAKIMVNTQMGVIESEKIFLGDPALFKRNDIKDDENLDTYVDLYKRWTGVGSTGTRLRYKYPGRSTSYNVSILNTQKFPSLYYDEMLEKHASLYERIAINKLSEEEKVNTERLKEIKRESKALAKDRLSKYTSMDSTDGTAFISPEMFREISLRMGLWDDRKQQAFDLLNSREQLSPKEIIKAGNIVFNPLKTMYIGHHNFNNVDLLIYNKMAMFTLFRQHVTGTHLEEVLDRMEVTGKYADRGLEKIHVYNYDTAVKVGALNGIDLFTNSKKRDTVVDLADSFVFSQTFDNLKHQQNVEAHDKMKQTFGTAGFKIASADIFQDEIYENGNTGKQLLNDLHRTRASLSDFGLHKIDARFGVSNGKVSDKMLIDTLRRAAEAANKSFDFTQALRIDLDTGEKYLEIDSFNDRKWIYARVKTIVDELAVDLTTPGTQLVQITDYGMNPTADYSDELKFIRSKVGDSKVYEMECRVSVRLFKNFFPRGHKITREEAQGIINNNPMLFGYRVPTQGQNSLVKLKVVDLLPEQTGDIIQLPLEFTTVTGSDFDIDKLYVALHNYEYSEDKTTGYVSISKIPFSTGNSVEEQRARYRAKILELFDIYKYSLESFRHVLVEDSTGKKIPIVSKYFGSSDIERIKLRAEFEEDKKFYNSEQKNLLAQIISIKDKLEESKNELYIKILENDLQNAQLKLEEIERKLFYTPYELFLKDRVNEADMASLETHLVESGKLKPFDEFINLPIEEQNTEKATQNKLLDLMFTVLSDEKHFINMTTPLGTMTSILEKKAETYENLYNPNYTHNVPALFTTTPSFQSSMKQKFSSAKMGVPPYALNNNHHSLTQMAGTQMISSINLGFNKKGLIDFSRIEGNDKKYITWWLSTLIDSHVDGVNKPFITSLNVNESTHTMLNFLIRAGVGEVAFDFINQPIFRDYSYAFFNTDRNYGSGSGRISTIKEGDARSYVFDLWAEIAVNRGVVTEEEMTLSNGIFIRDLLIPLPELLNASQLLADAKESAQSEKSREYFLRQLSILYHIKELKSDAATLNNFVLACRVDTRKYGSNPVEILYFLNNIKNVMYSEVDRKTNEHYSRFTNIDKILTIDKNYKYKEGDTFLPTLIKNSMFKIYDILKNDSLYASYGFNQILDDLMISTTTKEYSRMQMINIMIEELMTYFTSKFFSDPVNGFGVTREVLQNLILEADQEHSIYRILTSLKSGNHPLSKEVKDNPLLETLIVDFSMDVLEDKNGNSLPYTYIRSPFRSKRDDMIKDEVVDGYKDLMASPHPELNVLGRALYIYSFYTSGFRQRSVSSFSSSIPLQMNRELKYGNRIISLNAHMKNLLAKLNTSDGYLEFLTEAKREIFTNMWATKGFAYDLDPKYIERPFVNKDGEPIGIKVTLPMSELSRIHIGTNANRELITRPYVLVNGVLYEYMGYDSNLLSENNATYRSLYYVSISKKGMGTNGHGTKGLFLYEYSVPNIKGDERSILKANDPTTERYTQNEKKEMMLEWLGENKKDELDRFVPVPLEKQITVERGAGLSDNFYTEDEAAKLNEMEELNKSIEEANRQQQALERKPYSVKDLEGERTVTNKHNENLKASTDNLTTYENPIKIDVDGSYLWKENILGAAAYAELNDKKYFMRRNDAYIREYLNKVLEGRGYDKTEKITNPEAELYALLVVVDSFKNTSEHLYITQDYTTLLYFIDIEGVAVNPAETEESSIRFIKYTPNKNKPNMIVLVDLISKRIQQIKNNGGSVRIKYVPSKSTGGNRLVDQIAKGEHAVKENRNDFGSEKWGIPIGNLDNSTNAKDSNRGDELNNDICKIGE